MVTAKPTLAAPQTFEHEGLVLVVQDGEPVVSDAALATFLQAAGNDTREVIKRNLEAGHIAAVPNRRSERRYTKAGKSRGEQMVDGYLLTEADALFVVTRSNTPRAVAATKVMIAAFIAARRQLAGSPARPTPPTPPAPPPAKALPPAPPRMPRPPLLVVHELQVRLGEMLLAEDWRGVQLTGELIAHLAAPHVPPKPAA